MILINRSETDPYFNIAAEEYVLKNYEEDVFMLWINEPSVIIGKHQVATAEANILFTHLNDIPVVRRISGGGTVYHDEGNLNYSLISTGKEGTLVDYEKYAGTVIRALASLGINSYLENKSSLFTQGMKFSGNAEHVFKNRVLHHGTLLFRTNMDRLRQCIRPGHDGYNDRSVKSVDSNTINLSSLLPDEVGMEEFRIRLIRQVREDFPEIRDHGFNTCHRDEIKKLAEHKYLSDEWNFGYSPKYAFSKTAIIDKRQIAIELSTDKGRIIDIKIHDKGEAIYSDLTNKLIGKLHHPATIQQELNKINFAWQDELLAGLF